MLKLPRSLSLGLTIAALVLAQHASAQTISGITPSSVNAGSGGLVVAISGKGFNSGSLVRLNRSSGLQTLQTYFVNTNLILAGVNSNDVMNPGILPINVANYATQSTSNTVDLNVVGSSPGGGTPPPPPPTPPPPPPPPPGGCYGCIPPPPSPPPPPPPPPPPGGGGGSSGGPVTSPPGSNMLVTVTSPFKNETVKGTVTVTATAAQTNKTDGGIVYWAVFDAGNLLYVDVNPNSTLNIELALSKGAHTLQVAAYDDSYTASTATIPVVASASGNAITWHACIYTQNGQRYQAMKILPQQTVKGVLQSQMFWNSGCNPTQWTDQMNDVGTPMTFGAGSGYIFYFIHRANIPGVSAVWTMGDQTSGCVNYSSAPACN